MFACRISSCTTFTSSPFPLRSVAYVCRNVCQPKWPMIPGNTLQARLPFQDTQSIRGLDTGNLLRVTGKDDSGSLILGEVQQALHLPARDHACFINNQDPPAQRALWFLSLQKSGDSHRVTEANFFQFVHRTSGGSHRENFVSGLSEATVNFTQCRRLASTGSASNIDRQIARVEYSFDGALLFGTEMVR